VVSCGNSTDFRDPSYGPLVIRRIAELDLDEDFRVLGVVPRTDAWGLLRASSAVLNPSLYEGWSTSVEEAKSIGAPLVISDLPVHREQRPHVAYFFDPLDPESIADALGSAWDELPSGPRPDEERRAAAELIPRRQAFADRFVELANEAITRGRA
jgi:glycosyltransferase involved in cell wall biosynthesis